MNHEFWQDPESSAVVISDVEIEAMSHQPPKLTTSDEADSASVNTCNITESVVKDLSIVEAQDFVLELQSQTDSLPQEFQDSVVEEILQMAAKESELVETIDSSVFESELFSEEKEIETSKMIPSSSEASIEIPLAAYDTCQQPTVGDDASISSILSDNDTSSRIAVSNNHNKCK